MQEYIELLMAVHKLQIWSDDSLLWKIFNYVKQSSYKYDLLLKKFDFQKNNNS